MVNTMPFWVLLGRMVFIAAVLLLAFAAAGAWHPSRMPRWLAQVLAVVLAAPVRQNIVLLKRVVMHVSPSAIITDVGGTKRSIVDAAAEIHSIAIEEREPLGPFGARGIGEITMIPVVPAITSAIHAAIGAWS